MRSVSKNVGILVKEVTEVRSQLNLLINLSAVKKTIYKLKQCMLKLGHSVVSVLQK